MNCARCFHSGYAHDYHGNSMTRRGKCHIPGCECDGFVEMMHHIDEELA